MPDLVPFHSGKVRNEKVNAILILPSGLDIVRQEKFNCSNCFQAMQFDHYETTCCTENGVVPDQLASSEADLDIHFFSIEYLSCSILFSKEFIGTEVAQW